jgi:hypothetical protein
MKRGKTRAEQNRLKHDCGMLSFQQLGRGCSTPKLHSASRIQRIPALDKMFPKVKREGGVQLTLRSWNMPNQREQTERQHERRGLFHKELR